MNTHTFSQFGTRDASQEHSCLANSLRICLPGNGYSGRTQLFRFSHHSCGVSHVYQAADSGNNSVSVRHACCARSGVQRWCLSYSRSLHIRGSRIRLSRVRTTVVRFETRRSASHGWPGQPQCMSLQRLRLQWQVLYVWPQLSESLPDSPRPAVRFCVSFAHTSVWSIGCLCSASSQLRTAAPPCHCFMADRPTASPPSC